MIISAPALQPPTPAQIEEKLRLSGTGTHLFASPADWAELPARLKADPVAGAIYNAAHKRAEALLAGPLMDHKKEGRRRLGSARAFQGRIIDLAIVARTEGDSRYAARAREEMLAAAAIPDWGPGHFLDVAEYSLGVAIGLDWLHNSLSQEDRDTLADALITRAIRPTFDGTAASLTWLGGKSNWTQVCHAGLTAAALAIADRDPALAAKTIARAIAEQSGPNAAYAPDGVYPEGPMYWGYGTTFEVILISLVEHAFGTDYGLGDYPGFLSSTDYLAEVTSPCGSYFNYCDARESAGPNPALHWFAARRHQPAVAAQELARFTGTTSWDSPTGQPKSERYDSLALWWRKVPARGTQRDLALPLNWLGRGENPVAVLRSAWNDPKATFVGIKGGSPSSSHAHMDAGGFVLEADGVRWAVDPGMQDYESLESLGVQLWDARQNGERWGVFRLGPEGHNILRFNAGLQVVTGTAEFAAFAEGAPAPHAIVDLSPVYAGEATEVRRGVSLLPDRRVVFQDEWKSGPGPVEVTWQWLTRAAPTIDGGTIVLRQAGATLRLRITSPDLAKVEVEDVAKPKQAFDTPNPGLRRIRVIMRTDAGASGRLVVVAEPGTAHASGTVATKPLSSW